MYAERGRQAGQAPQTPEIPPPLPAPIGAMMGGGLDGAGGGMMDSGGGAAAAALEKVAVAVAPRDGMEMTGSAEWLSGHAFHARDGASVSVKDSLDHSQEVGRGFSGGRELRVAVEACAHVVHGRSRKTGGEGERMDRF